MARNIDGFKAIRELLKKVKEGREYILSAGQHAAVIKLDKDKKIRYLELQHPDNNKNKYKVLNAKTIGKGRFHCEHRTISEKTNEVTESVATLLDINDLKGNSEFRRIMGYINTKRDKQRKGEDGKRK